MTLSDFSLLGKKILVGVVLVIVPFIILWFSIRLSLKLNAGNQPVQPVAITSNK